MRQLRRGRRAALAVVGALLVGACGSDEPSAGDGPSATPVVGEQEPTDAPIATDLGVSEDACPEAVNPGNGCIYLGTLSDLTEGPFAALAIQIVAGQNAFWARVNADGGLGGYDVNVTEYVRDNKYNPEEHVAQFRQIEPMVLALAQSLGTSTTLAALDLMKANNVIGAPASWWSGWAFEDVILDSGQSSCVEAMNGLDHANTEMLDEGVSSVMVITHPDENGADAAAGVALWAGANDVDFDAATDSVQTLPRSAGGTQDGPVNAIVAADPSVVYLATGPVEAAEIIGKAVGAGYDGRFVGAVPTFNPALLANDDVAAILPSVYRQVVPWGPFGSDTPAHQAMAAAVGEELPANDGFTFGWVWQYPLKSAIEQAVTNRDLTRAGLRAAAATMTVDYEGALPSRTYRGGATAVKQAIIAVPDPDAPLGLSVRREFFTGPTAEAFALNAPCVSLG